LSQNVIQPYRFVAGAESWSTANDNCILGGGCHPEPWSSTESAMKYTGTWSTITSLPASRQLLMGGGNFDDGIMMGGDSGGTSNNHDDVYGWNGSSWDTLALLSIDNQMFCGGGNTTNAIWYSGTYGAVDTCQTFDSSTWSTVNSLVHGIRGALGSGKSSDAFCMGGYNGGAYNQTYNQQFDGTDWALSTTCPSTLFYGYNSGAGLSGIQIVSVQEDSTGANYTFDSSAFATTSNTNYLRLYSMMGGDATNAMKAGGYDSGLSADYSETYDSSTWSTQGVITETMFGSGMGGNTV